MAEVTPRRPNREEVNRRRRMLTLARTIVEQILAQRGEKRPSGPRITLKFPNRVAGKFALLHGYAPDEQALAAVLNAALPKKLELRFSVADPTVHFPWDGYTALALHPAEMDVSNLTEVPDKVRIFKFNTVAPYDIAESPVLKPDRIAAAREHRESPLTPLRNAWAVQHESLARRLLARVTAERDRQAETLPAPVLTVVNDLLAHSHTNPSYYLMETLQAAAFLGILPEVTVGFGEDEA